MARSMPWSNAVNKRKCPSYKTEKIDVKRTKKNGKKRQNSDGIAALLVRTSCHEMDVFPLIN